MAPSMKGDRVTLRSPKPSDKADRLALGRSPEIVRLFGGDTRDLAPLTETEIDAWYETIRADPCSWIIEHQGRCIGSTRLHSIDEDERSAFYAVGILDPSLLGQGLGREVTALILGYAFETLQLQRVDLRVLSFNLRAIRSYRASGFSQTMTHRSSVQIDGQWYDDVIMSIRREEWNARPGRARPE